MNVSSNQCGNATVWFPIFALQVYFTYIFLRAPHEETGTKCWQALEIMGSIPLSAGNESKYMMAH